MARDFAVGVDLGGTKILTGVGDRAGNILSEMTMATEPEEGLDAVVARLVRSIEGAIVEAGISQEQVDGVAIATPGPLNIEEGIIYQAPNLGWENVNLVELMSDRLPLPIQLENDANAAALGANRFGAGKGSKDMIYITVSTGIGGGLVLDGSIYHGVGDGAGEVGHMTLDPQGPRCNCGKRGCWEAIASGTALLRQVEEGLNEGVETILRAWMAAGKELDGALIAEAARKKDRFALGLYRRQGFHLGLGLANLINLLNPEVIVIGGGVTNAWDLFAETMEEALKEYSLAALLSQVEIKKSLLGSRVGLLGALAVAWAQANDR
ncbi:MAG: ROK family protein [Halanaerobium sp.]|nr:ROK family protein [Halanaerobium sp.]